MRQFFYGQKGMSCSLMFTPELLENSCILGSSLTRPEVHGFADDEGEEDQVAALREAVRKS